MVEDLCIDTAVTDLFLFHTYNRRKEFVFNISTRKDNQEASRKYFLIKVEEECKRFYKNKNQFRQIVLLCPLACLALLRIQCWLLVAGCRLLVAGWCK